MTAITVRWDVPHLRVETCEASALCNAVFAATGRRIRRLPINDQLAQT